MAEISVGGVSEKWKTKEKHFHTNSAPKFVTKLFIERAIELEISVSCMESCTGVSECECGCECGYEGESECKCDCLLLLPLLLLWVRRDCSLFDFFIAGATRTFKNKRDEKEENHKSAGGG